MNLRYLLLILLPLTLNAGFYSDNYVTPGGISDWMLYGFEPDACVAAMGKTHSASSKTSNMPLYNPSYVTSSPGAKLHLNTVRYPYQVDSYGRFALSAIFTYSPYVNIGISSCNFLIGQTMQLVNTENMIADTVETFTGNSFHAIHYGAILPFGLRVGLDASLFRYVLKSEDDKLSWNGIPVVNLGLSYPLSLGSKKKISNTVLFDFVYRNMLDAKVKDSKGYGNYVLPIELVGGVGYELNNNSKNSLMSSFLVQTTFRDLLNSEHHSRLGVGGQIELFEIIQFILGYYQENIQNGLSHDFRESVEDLTYGFGITAPTHSLLKSSLCPDIQLDFTSLREQGIDPLGEEYNRFTSLSIEFTWRISKNL